MRTSDAHGGHSARPSLSLHVCPKLPCGPMNWLGPTLFMSVVGYPSPLPFSFPLEVPRIETLVKLSSRLQGARELLSLSFSLSLCLCVSPLSRRFRKPTMPRQSRLSSGLLHGLACLSTTAPTTIPFSRPLRLTPASDELLCNPPSFRTVTQSVVLALALALAQNPLLSNSNGSSPPPSPNHSRVKHNKRASRGQKSFPSSYPFPTLGNAVENALVWRKGSQEILWKCLWKIWLGKFFFQLISLIS